MTHRKVIITEVFRVSSNGVTLRPAKVSDAEFILNLRLNQSRSKYISETSGLLENQEEWLKSYLLRFELQQEFYFIIESKENTPLGTLRIYNTTENSFEWGSWLIVPNAKSTVSVISANLLYYIAFELLQFSSSYFDVRKQNLSVWNFHEKMGASFLKEDEENRYYTYPNTSWHQAIQRKYKRFIEDLDLSFLLTTA